MNAVQTRLVKARAKQNSRFGQTTIYVSADYQHSTTLLDEAIEQAKESEYLVPHFYAVNEKAQITFHEPYVSLTEFKEHWKASKQPIGG